MFIFPSSILFSMSVDGDVNRRGKCFPPTSFKSKGKCGKSSTRAENFNDVSTIVLQLVHLVKRKDFFVKFLPAEKHFCVSN